MAHLLIIGGSGFFGKSILHAYHRGLLQCFEISTITVMARNAEGLINDAPELLDKSIILLNSDIAKCTTLPTADFIIHAAASTDERNYINHPKEERENIETGTNNFCKLASKYCTTGNILYVSSGAAYGQQPDDLLAISEEFFSGSINELESQKQDYARAKQDAEDSIRRLGNDNIKVSIARCFTFIGAYLPRQQHFAIGNFIDNGLNGRPISVRTDYLVYRSYMHADDLVKWLLTIASNASTSCPIYNVGSDRPILISDLAKKIGKYFDVSAKIPNIASKKIDRYVPSIKKARVELGLNITVDLDLAIEKTVNEIKNK